MLDYEYSQLCMRLAGKTVDFKVGFQDIYLLLASLDSMLNHPQVEDYGDIFESKCLEIRNALLEGFRSLGVTEEQVNSLDEFSRMEDDLEIVRDGSHLSIVGCGEDEDEEDATRKDN
jgi:hypothetical protein